MNGRCQHTHTHHHPPHPLNQPCSRTMIPLPPSLPPSPPSPFPVLLCTEQVRTIRGFQDCSMEFAVFFDKGAQRAGVEQRREDARAAFARGEEAMRAGDHAKGIYYPSHPPTHPYCLPPSPACSKGRPSCAVPWVRVPAPQPEKSSWPVCTPRTAWWSSSPQLSKRCCHQGQISTLQTTSPAMRQKTARGYKLTMALLPSSAWLG